jgi:hypothetical protein
MNGQEQDQAAGAGGRSRRQEQEQEQETMIGHISYAISHLSFEDSVVSGDL